MAKPKVRASDHLWLAEPGDYLHPIPDHPLAWQRDVHRNAQRLPVEVINDVEQPKVTLIF
jgi:hypothetical protein